MTAGAAITAIANSIWLFAQFISGTTEYSDVTYFLWLLAYFSYLAALIWRTKEFRVKDSTASYVFNIVVFMIASASISVHYLIRPVIDLSDSAFYTVVTLAFPVASLSILFAITILYTLLQHSREKLPNLYIILGFFVQVVADFGFAFQSVSGGYLPGSTLDLLWVYAVLLLGTGGFVAVKSRTGGTVRGQPFERKETFFPYISMVVLLFAVMSSYEWKLNHLSLGFSITFFLVIGRQWFVLRKNGQLVKEYRHLAYHDPLTGLRNRFSFTEDLASVFADRAQCRVALLLIDLDRFKVINDTLGHTAGDKILRMAAGRLESVLQDTNALYRLGGDEFIIVLPDADEALCEDTAATIISSFQEPFRANGYDMIVTPSIGISRSPDNGSNGDELLKFADAAMYLAKESGKNNYRFYNAALHDTINRKMKLEHELRMAIERGQLSLVYQPKVDLRTRRMIGMEALLRWEHPEFGPVSPAEFIPIAEETGQIVRIGEWVLVEACRRNKRWQEEGYASLCVSANVSVRQFQHYDFVNVVRKALRTSGLSPEYLELEITESVMQDAKESSTVLREMRRLGVKTSIDDFGTGYSSLHMLQRLPIDTIKIDKSFIDHLEDTAQLALVKTIIDLGLRFGLNVVAEGIESEQQMKALVEHHCQIGQGYLFSKPVGPEEFERLLERLEEQSNVFEGAAQAFFRV
ncbi:bifunctional diguanylate cyclase/phosphodiesterase [Paenibacillus sp. TRM 82003]|nr:bifunctional diguanylate cyclase/phosphodiesterase [Paenibacillus sp. TRM 82003]